MKSKFFLLLTVWGLILVGCSNDSPSLEGVSVKMKAVTSQSTINTTGRVKASGVVFEQALLGVTKLEFNPSSGDSTDSEGDDHGGHDGHHGDGNDDGGNDGDHDSDSLEVEFKGPFIVDLINGTSTPDLGSVSMQPGVYHEIEVKMGPVLEDGNSVFIAFTYDPAGDSIPVQFSTKEIIKFEIENVDGYSLDANTLTNILVLFNLDSLFANIDLSSATVDADGVIRINDSSNTAITDAILSNTHHSCEAGEDHDHNGEIDED